MTTEISNNDLLQLQIDAEKYNKRLIYTYNYVKLYNEKQMLLNKEAFLQKKCETVLKHYNQHKTEINDKKRAEYPLKKEEQNAKRREIYKQKKDAKQLLLQQQI